jgi:hypothetical protein
LLSTGLGSLVSERFAAMRNRAFACLAALLLAYLAFYQLGLSPLIERGIGWPFALRVALVIAAIAPLELGLGAFMPLGIATVARLTVHREEFVAWCWR